MGGGARFFTKRVTLKKFRERIPERVDWTELIREDLWKLLSFTKNTLWNVKSERMLLQPKENSTAVASHLFSIRSSPIGLSATVPFTALIQQTNRYVIVIRTNPNLAAQILTALIGI